MVLVVKGPVTVGPYVIRKFSTPPAIFRISSRPQLPASLFPPSTQFRKGRRQGHNQRKHYAIFKELPPFRAWVLGADGAAGAWGRDEIRDIVGLFSGILCGDTAYSGALYPAVEGEYTTSSGGGRTHFKSLYFAASHAVPTGPQNVPQHISQPVILYLGRPR